MNTSNLAPIVFFAYNRPEHTSRALSALKDNQLIEHTILHIYVDGPKINATEEQKNNIKNVIEIVRAVNWTKEVHLHISENNIGCRDSIIRGITEVINKYEKAIVIEDDIITSPSFLIYINKALDYYRNKPSVFSISGHSYSPDKVLIPEDYEYDVYASPRLFNWGWGTWSDRWNHVNWELTFVPEFLKKREQVSAFNRGGEDLSQMLREQYEGNIDAWDIQFSYSHFSNHAISIVPCKSYTRNIGFDGTGTHCYIDHLMDKTDINLNREPCFLDVLYEDKRIINSLYSFYYPHKRPLWKKISNRISRFFIGKNIFTIKKKIYV